MRFGYRRLHRIEQIVVHHSASPRDTTTIADFEKWHVTENGWAAIGYHVVILGDGTEHLPRPLDAIPAANPPHNQTSIAICLAGNFAPITSKNPKGGEVPSAVQLEVLEQRIAAIEKVLGREFPVRNHRNVGRTRTACPGFDLAAQVA